VSKRQPSGAGVAASLLIIVLLSAAFMAGLVFSGDIDTANRVIAIGIFIPLMASSVVFASALFRALFADRIARKRWEGINQELYGMGVPRCPAA
jgi:ABC-type sugar transport system permease subunit